MTARQPDILEPDLALPQDPAPAGAAAPEPAAAAGVAPAVLEPLVDTTDPLQDGPGRVKRAVRQNELQLTLSQSLKGGSAPGSAPGSSGSSSARGSPGPASARAAGAHHARRRERCRSGRVLGGVEKLGSALDPRKLPRRLHNLSTDLMSIELFSQLLAQEVCVCARPMAQTRGWQRHANHGPANGVQLPHARVPRMDGLRGIPSDAHAGVPAPASGPALPQLPPF
jgi:hypothetical protein